MKLTKPFKYSVNGYIVEHFEAGEHDDVHPDVVAYARKIGALAEGKAQEKPGQEKTAQKKSRNK